jgi:hypothetical protein
MSKYLFLFVWLLSLGAYAYQEKDWAREMFAMVKPHEHSKRSAAAQVLTGHRRPVKAQNLITDALSATTSTSLRTPYYLISVAPTTANIGFSQSWFVDMPNVRKFTITDTRSIMLVRTDETRDQVTHILREHGFYDYKVEPSLQHSLGSVTTDVLDRLDQPELPLDGSYTSIGTALNAHLYVVDSGILESHDEFTGRVTHDFTTPGETNTPCNFHGSWVASIAAGATLGAASSAFIHDYHVARVAELCGFFTSDGVDALADILLNGQLPGVINLSWQGGGSSILDDLISDLFDAGFVIVAAAGNAASSTAACLNSPARASRAISVGAIDFTDTRASFSNYGNCIDIWAPGVNIIGADIASDSATDIHSGTSGSTPVVSSVALVYYVAFGSTSASEVYDRIRTSSAKHQISGVDPNAANNRIVSIYFYETTFTPTTASTALRVF